MSIKHPDFATALAAIREGDAVLWEIGDAVLVECGGSGVVGSQCRLREASAEIAASGLTLPHPLRILRDVAENFPPDRRHADVSWAEHRAASMPWALDAIVAATAAGEDPVAAVEAARDALLGDDRPWEDPSW